jgi:hypothetical protein
MMNYEDPEMEIIYFAEKDIVTTSPGEDEGETVKK